jgi:hypothetical protein
MKRIEILYSMSSTIIIIINALSNKNTAWEYLAAKENDF